MDHGHPYAQEYPIGLVYAEANLVAERLNQKQATDAILAQMAISSTQSKKAAGLFTKITKSLMGK